MADKLMIVESPSKAKTIEKYLGGDFTVASSKGHIRDLAIRGPGGLGIDVEDDFKPTYDVLKDKKKIVRDLKKSAKNADELYLATDPDREGEAIAWHLKETLNPGDKPVHRVVFHEITKPAVKKAIEDPGEIDQHLVASQETRRMLDRIIGFKLSKLLQRKIKSKSAGRVQSAALKMIVDKEREIEAFEPEEYYDIKAVFDDFEADLFKHKGKKVKRPGKTKADSITEKLDTTFTVASVKTKKRRNYSRAPFITSTLEQDASNKLGFSSSRTMRVAQDLYEGIDLGEETVGLITYMRTDSIRLSGQFIDAAKDAILTRFGKTYVGKPKRAVKKGGVQDAHEAIRPTDVARTPDDVKSHLSKDQFRLYELIYNRAVSSLMTPAVFDQTTMLFENNDTVFKLTGSELVFDGYLKLYGKDDRCDDGSCDMPDVKEKDAVEAKKIAKEQKFTQPPARFTEAKLIKTMESKGIGRPSTYSSTIQTIRNRHYVTYESRHFIPTEQGKLTIDKLEKFFSEFISTDYSKHMEQELDKIAEGDDDQVRVLREFYDYFMPLVDHAMENMKKIPPKKTGEMCPKCGSPLVVRHGPYGEFVACSNYPDCKYIKPSEEEEELYESDVTCPECGKGKIVERVAKRGKNKGNHFFACDNFPKCRYVPSEEELKELCPECHERMLKANGDDGEE